MRLKNQYPKLVLWLLALCVVNIQNTTMYAQCYATRSGNTFAVGNAEFRFIGVNIGGLHIHFKPDETTLTSNAEITHQLNAANAMGAKVIRVFGCDRVLTNVQNGDRLENLLNLMGNVNGNMKVIVSLTNFYNNGGYFPAGDEGAHSGGLIAPFWFTGGYNTHYKPWVQYVVNRFKSDTRIFAWELGNELQAGNATDMLNFAYDVGHTIKNIGANQMVSTGFIGVNHACNGGVNSGLIGQFYNGPWAGYSQSPFDFGSVHAYNNEQSSSAVNDCTYNNPQHNQHDIQWFINAGYPYIVGEGGFTGALTNSPCGQTAFTNNGCTWDGTSIPGTSGSRVAAVTATCNKFFDEKSCDGFLQWGFRAPNGDPQNGQGDDCAGMDAQYHSDYDGLKAYYAGKASGLPSGGSCNALPNCTSSLNIGGITFPVGEHHYYASENILVGYATVPANSTIHLHAKRIQFVNITYGNAGNRFRTHNDPCTLGATWPQNRMEQNAIQINSELSGIQAFPNPFNEFIRIQRNENFPEQELVVKLYSLLGVLVKKEIKLSVSAMVEIQTSDIPKGLYLLVIEQNNKKVFQSKMLKE
jgi:hypothetical protein